MAATIRIEIASSSSGTALRDTAKDLRDIDSTARTASGGFNVFSGAVAAALGGVALSAVGAFASTFTSAIGDSVKQAGEFEAGINTLAAVTGSALGDAGYSFDDVRNKALQLGADTKYSAQESLAAMTELAKGGLPIEQVMTTATDATLNLAAAAGVDLANAAEIVASQFAIWNDTGVTVTNVSDLLTQAANASKVGVEDLSLGLANSGLSAKIAGVEFNDLVQTMGLIAPGFSSAADAGTSLKTFLSRLIPTTKPATEAMIELGLATEDGKSKFYDAQGSFIGMEAAAKLLATATAGLSEEQKSLAFNTIFGSDAVRAAGMIAEAGADGFNAFGAAMATAGTAAETAAMMNQGYDASMQALSGSMDTLKIVVGTALLPLLTQLAGQMTEAVNVATVFAQAVFGNSDAFGQLSPVLQQVVAGIQSMIPVVQEIAGSIASNWQPILAAVAGVIGALVIPALVSFVTAAAPVIAAVAAAIAIGAALQAAWTSNFGNIQGLTQQALAAIQGIITSVMGAVLTFWQANGSQIMSFAQSTWNQIQTIVGTVTQIVATVVRNVFGGIQQFLSNHGSEIQTVLKFAWDSIQNIVQLALNLIQGTTTTVLGVLQGDWGKAGEGIKQIVSGIQTYVTDQFNNILRLVQGIGPTLLSAATSVGKAIVDGIASGISAASGAIAEAAKRAAQSALDAAKKLLGIKSPSSVFAAEVGAPMAQGMAVGMLQAAPVAVGAAQAMAGAATAGARSTVINRSVTVNQTFNNGPAGYRQDAAIVRSIAGV